jgi:hypothetical protein
LQAVWNSKQSTSNYEDLFEAQTWKIENTGDKIRNAPSCNDSSLVSLTDVSQMDDLLTRSMVPNNLLRARKIYFYFSTISIGDENFRLNKKTGISTAGKVQCCGSGSVSVGYVGFLGLLDPIPNASIIKQKS